jgi:hypothetical protein
MGVWPSAAALVCNWPQARSIPAGAMGVREARVVQAKPTPIGQFWFKKKVNKLKQFLLIGAGACYVPFF